MRQQLMNYLNNIALDRWLKSPESFPWERQYLSGFEVFRVKINMVIQNVFFYRNSKNFNGTFPAFFLQSCVKSFRNFYMSS